MCGECTGTTCSTPTSVCSAEGMANARPSWWTSASREMDRCQFPSSWLTLRSCRRTVRCGSPVPSTNSTRTRSRLPSGSLLPVSNRAAASRIRDSSAATSAWASWPVRPERSRWVRSTRTVTSSPSGVVVPRRSSNRCGCVLPPTVTSADWWPGSSAVARSWARCGNTVGCAPGAGCEEDEEDDEDDEDEASRVDGSSSGVAGGSAVVRRAGSGTGRLNCAGKSSLSPTP